MERQRDLDRSEPVDAAERNATMKMRTLGRNGPLVAGIALACMRMSNFAGPKASTDEEGIATIQAALDAGINFLNTGDFYGMGHNELLVGQAIKGHRDQALISV
jgi:aryl-alcohol dehydrogenase-like predicted oxidoreductase